MPRKKSNRDDQATKIDRLILEKAKLVARERGISVAEYLSELTRSLVEKDFTKALASYNKRLTGQP